MTSTGTEESNIIQRDLLYPHARKSDHIDITHGIPVADPYRWLEDIQSEETTAWIEIQNQLTRAYFSEIPGYDRIRQRLNELSDYEKWSIPSRHGSRYLVSRNNGVQNHPVLYAMDSIDSEGRVLLDPNTWSEDGRLSLAGVNVSRDGTYLTHGVSTAGSDWQELRVLEISTGRTLDDKVTGVKFSGGCWSHDARGFFYTRYRAAGASTDLSSLNRLPRVYYHRLGTPEENDELIHWCPEQPDWLLHCTTTDDDHYLIITATSGRESKNTVLYKDLRYSASLVQGLLLDCDASYGFVANDGPLFWFRTNLNAPRWRVIRVDIRTPERSHWQETIPESDDVLQRVSLVGNKFIARYLTHAHSRVKVFSKEGAYERDIELPGVGTVIGFAGSSKDTETFYAYTSFAHPVTIYRYDVASGTTTLFKRPQLGFDPDDYETRQVFCPSRDNTNVPVFLTYRKGIKLDGSNPLHLYGYGGFRNSLTPSFSVGNLVWMEMGGIHAVANVRGGGEYGEGWYRAGTRADKQNSFDDFIGAAEWLIRNRYTSPNRLAASGGSNGGLLVAACAIQRPDLFRAVSIVQGVLDMLRFHKFTIGWTWIKEYGSPDVEEDFKVLHAYSPLHNIVRGVSYPATLIHTADNDDRVWPGASLKFAATLQEAQGGPAPILIEIDRNQGHGAGTTTAALMDRYARAMSFFSRHLQMDFQFEMERR